MREVSYFLQCDCQKPVGFCVLHPLQLRSAISAVSNLLFFAYFGFANAIEVLVNENYKKPKCFLSLSQKITDNFRFSIVFVVFPVDPLSRIRNINGRKLLVFVTLRLASAIELLFFAMRFSKTNRFLHNAPFTAQILIIDSQYPQPRTYIFSRILASQMQYNCKSTTIT